jgi:hypothetical protein
MLSLAEAASLTGLNKTTVMPSIKSSRLTGTKDPLVRQVGEAELLRVYGRRAQPPRPLARGRDQIAACVATPADSARRLEWRRLAG